MLEQELAELWVDLRTPSNQTSHTLIVDMALEKLVSKAHPCLGQTNSVRGTNYQAHRVYRQSFVEAVVEQGRGRVQQVAADHTQTLAEPVLLEPVEEVVA